jgi:8-oxo-dGTP pyrophosphatase MutT (NUDIX family)
VTPTDAGVGAQPPLDPDGVELVDRLVQLPVSHRERRYEGMKWDVVTETVALPDGVVVRRDVVEHPGAVGVLALDDSGRVLLVRQYRHPVHAELWELPAGLLDEVGEIPLDAARRELAEEADLVAERWDTLVDLYSSPGMSGEAYRIFLARDVSDVPPAQRHVRTEEEAGLVIAWFDLDQACEAALAGRVHNAMAVTGLLAAASARRSGWAQLRPADSPWPHGPKAPAEPGEG